MKPKLLLLHGALGSKAQFGKLKENLSTQFEVYDLDFEGHGKKESTKDFTIDLFTENVIEFLKENQLEQINIFGYSMGGYVALNLARKAPHCVGKIVTLGTKFNWTKETAEKEMRMLNPEKIAEKVPAFANQLATIHGSGHWKAVLNKTAQMMYGLGTGKKITTTELEQIEQEVLIGIGSKDKMVSVEESKESATILPNGKLAILADFPHQIEKVNKVELSKIIEQFLIK
ncbi:MAG: alpha/beta fold hydrolase [Saprospiraceae bacterium]